MLVAFTFSALFTSMLSMHDIWHCGLEWVATDIVGGKPLQGIISSKAERSLLSWNKLMLKSPIKTTVSFVWKEDKISQ